MPTRNLLHSLLNFSLLSFIRRFAIHLLLSLLLTGMMMLSDHIYQAMSTGYQTHFSLPTFTILSIVTFLILGSSQRFFIFIFIIFALLQFTELLHFSYFGTLISPHAVILLFQDTGEILESLGGMLGHIALPILLFISQVILAIAFYRRTTAHRLSMPYAWIPMLLLLSILPMKASKPDAVAQQFYPNPNEYAVANGLFSFSYFLGRDLPQKLNGSGHNISCLAYTAEHTSPPQAENIIIIMGESLSSSHMGLFGYTRDTTPRLNALRDNKNFIFKNAYSAAVSTKVTLPMFFNVQREPGHITHMVTQTSNLFRLAKEQGYNTHFISAQTANLATYIGEKYIDSFITQESLPQKMLDKKDRLLLEQLRGIDLTRKNFIVLHQRNSHSPYEKQYPREFAIYPEKAGDHLTNTINSYDNSVLFTDDLLADIIEHINNRSTRPTLLVFTADHAELLGEGGKMGHAHLQENVARVPMIAYGKNLSDSMLERFSSMNNPSHYEIGKQIAAALGYTINNPNEQDALFFINGPDIGGRSGYLAINKKTNTVTSSLEDNSITPCPVDQL